MHRRDASRLVPAEQLLMDGLRTVDEWRTFDEYARHRGFVIDAAVVRHATGKPLVERNVQYVRENFFRGETWLDAAHVHREAICWCTATAGTRIHGTTRERPLVRFDTERAALQPLTQLCGASGW